MYSFSFVFLIVAAVFYFRAAEMENGPGVLWAALSVVISLVMGQVLRFGLLGMVFGQIALFIGITLYRARR